jgi:hypothetical protein
MKKTAFLEAHSGVIVVTYEVTSRTGEEITIEVHRVVPARAEGSMHLGEPLTPTREEHISILRALAALEFELDKEATPAVPG